MLQAFLLWQNFGLPEDETAFARLTSAFTNVFAEGVGGGAIVSTILLFVLICTAARCAILNSLLPTIQPVLVFQNPVPKLL
jgi:hypothetical protein